MYKEIQCFIIVNGLNLKSEVNKFVPLNENNKMENWEIECSDWLSLTNQRAGKFNFQTGYKKIKKLSEFLYLFLERNFWT
jgi:hypothetical protein